MGWRDKQFMHEHMQEQTKKQMYEYMQTDKQLDLIYLDLVPS